ncbi:uncharacterized protein LOC125052400 [Pieris napi]|uniref:uncharacterized protein LOC125052400 n=1 Tax=Pieris napi TaxID=78633 RepID=UPI001FBA2093|nr:uncharacterized protein LOC125052400 [Pieris napi]
MRAIVAIFFLATCTNGLRETKNTKLLRDVTNCVKHNGLSKCVVAFGVWKAERAIEPDLNEFIWIDYVNHTDEELYSRLCDGTERLLRYRPLTMDLGDRYTLKMKSTGNNSLNFDVIENKNANTGRTSTKKMTKTFYQALPFLILPGIVMSAILPFFLPTLTMATVATVMLNNMALVGAVLMLLRNNAFNDRNYPKKVIYLNAGYGFGYDRPKYDPLANAPSENLDEVVSPNHVTEYSTEVTHDTKDYHLVGVDPSTGISYPFNADWLKNTQNSPSKVKNVQIIGEVPSVTDWLKPNYKWPPASNR